MRKISVFAAVLVLGLAAEVGAQVPAKKIFPGGLDSIGYEYLLARSLGLDFMPDTLSIFSAAADGRLVSLWGDPYLKIDDDVSFPFVLPATKLWLDSIKVEYQLECKEFATITSASRASLEQPRNAHALSVHPAGLVVDLRVPPPRCFRWFVRTLTRAREFGAINVIEEKVQPHFHIMVRPDRIEKFLTGAKALETD